MIINNKGVFFDASGQRWRWCKRIAIVAGFAAVLTAGLFVASLYQDPNFPQLQLNPAELLSGAENKDAVGEPGILLKAEFVPEENGYPAKPLPRSQSTAPSPKVFGFYVPWNQSSLVSLKANAPHLTHVLAEWLILADADGSITDAVEPDVVDWARNAHLPVLVMLTNYRDNQWRSADLHQVLSDPAKRRKLVTTLHDTVEQYQLAGVNIDFEQVNLADRQSLVTFLKELRAALPAGSSITEDVPTDDENVASFDLQQLAALNDFVIPMAYDEHYPASQPGPVAALPWFRRQLIEILKMLPPEKTVVGMGNYGYDWTLGTTRSAVEVSFEDVMTLAGQNGGTVDWHGESASPVLRYQRNGAKHEVWFLDAVAALNQLHEVQGQGFAGVSFWRLGAEDPGLWTVLANHSWPNEQLDTSSLAKLVVVAGVRQYGKGEAIRVTQTRSEGVRHVERTAAGEYRESVERNPTGDVIGSVGHSDRKLFALTFDDGPDPAYTPRILDILKEKQVPAAFFVVGEKAEDQGALLRRTYAEGHIVGNHTYSHGNELVASEPSLRMELNLTQRIIEHALGRSATLIRSPYNADSEPRTPEAILSVLRPQRYGYTTLGERVDPRDWETNSPDEILSVIEQDKHLGHVILLHDGGGDRSATITALPLIIDQLRAEGYELVGVNQLLGRSREELMPVTSAGELRWATIEGGLLAARGTLLKVIQFIFMTAIGLTLLRTLSYAALSLLQKRCAGRRKFDPSYRPRVSVVIAAHNEEKVVVRTVQAVLASHYPNFEVLVVDDGSTDGTLSELETAFAGDARVRVLTQENGGKSTALNRAIAQAKGEVLVALDADTLFEPEAIALLARHFADPQVAAVSGNVKVGNAQNLVARLQSIEYICGFNLDRRALDVLNAVAVVPGAVGAWRRSAVLEAGGYSCDTVAEDIDLTLALRRKGYLIRYEEHALAHTEAPESVSALARQRIRWAFGTLQAAWKHRDVTFRPRFGTMAFITLPTIWLYQIMFAAISPFAEVALVLGILGGNPRSVITYYAIFLTFEFLTALFAFSLEQENPLQLRYLIVQRLLYPRLMLYVVVKSLVHAIAGRPLGWSVNVRHASVRMAAPDGAKARA